VNTGNNAKLDKGREERAANGKQLEDSREESSEEIAQGGPRIKELRIKSRERRPEGYE
jgi:hypothetical protein